MHKFFLYILVFSTILVGCTSDDICSEGSATTPLLIITFKDFTNPELAKQVSSLTVKTADESAITLINRVTTDSIAIPLNNNSNSTQLYFIKNDSDDNTGNIDTLTFTYERQDIYVNRACGFIANYTNLQGNLETENNTNWIQQISILKTTIEDETSAHITILH
jgi:hypothetical protein